MRRARALLLVRWLWLMRWLWLVLVLTLSRVPLKAPSSPRPQHEPPDAGQRRRQMPLSRR